MNDYKPSMTAMLALKEAKDREKKESQSKMEDYRKRFGTPTPEPPPELDASAELVILRGNVQQISNLKFREPSVYRQTMEHIETKAKAAMAQYQIANLKEFMTDSKGCNDLSKRDSYAYQLLSATHWKR